jgi:Holliday junction resolvase RusA-like endonuclease
MNANTQNENVQLLALKIFGEPASKANSRKMVYIHGKPMFIKSEKALAYAKAFKQQCVGGTSRQIDGDVSVTIRIWYASRRPDLDESLILDLLQGVAYENDRQVKEKHIYWMPVDKANPRCEIVVEKIKPPL